MATITEARCDICPDCGGDGHAPGTGPHSHFFTSYSVGSIRCDLPGCGYADCATCGGFGRVSKGPE